MMSHHDANMIDMKSLCICSGVVLFLSVCSLESSGAWWLVTLGTAAVSLAALWITSAKLGLFG